ncbi:exonuclease/endonuclease/phosphatase family protein [Levilactobacillus tujiorum]|uniref:hypothetical protein n=1 Tax=Levilactobacillus tujiorum TaxID=2912243 RepID=UPI00145646D9|nr:hypothetical protein [Levilactobacillus tujiorum]NLR31322.1 hypothetical protein [Levilactobacillus tujiorum]
MDLVNKFLSGQSESPEDFEMLSKGEFEFSTDSISPENAAYHRVAASRLRRVLLGLYNIVTLSGKNYETTTVELQALINHLEEQYKETYNAYDLEASTNNFVASLGAINYSVLCLNVNGKINTVAYEHASLMNDVWPALVNNGLPDVLLLNELSRREVGFENFVKALERAGYRVLHDTRPIMSGSNEALIAIGPRLLLKSTKVEIIYPDKESGLDAIAAVFSYFDNTKLCLIACRLHSTVDTSDLYEHYQNIADNAIPQLRGFLTNIRTRFSNRIRFIGGGDFNNGKIRQSYDGLAQAPASHKKIKDGLKKLKIDLITPDTGYSNRKQHTEIDHMFTSESISIKNSNYRELLSPNIDHNAVVADVIIPLLSAEDYYQGLLKSNTGK